MENVNDITQDAVTQENFSGVDHNKDQNPETETIKDPIEVVDDIESKIYELVNSFIQNELDNPNDIYNNNGLFVLMLKYIYRYYLVDILKNSKNKGSNRYDYKLLDKLFWIYTGLVYKYKKNCKPNILEFCVFTVISKDNLYNGVKGYIKKLTQEDIDIIKTWFIECENGFMNSQGVFDIFILKSQYGYNDNLASVPLELQQNILSVDQLPDLSSSVSRIEDHDNGNK